jgi:hypothetical protein
MSPESVYLLTNRCKLPLPIARVIVDMAEYWACTKRLSEATSGTQLSHSGEPIAFPVAPNETRLDASSSHVCLQAPG